MLCWLKPETVLLPFFNAQWTCILYNQRDALYTMFFNIISALHVSGGFSAHHPELIKLYVQPWYCHPSVQSTPAVDSRKTWQYPRLHIQFYNLLMMGGKTARNMQTADNNEEHYISCISLVIYNTHILLPLNLITQWDVLYNRNDSYRSF